MTKKSLFTAVSLILTFGLVLMTAIAPSLKVPLAFFLSILALGLTIFSLGADVSGIEYFTLTFLPTLFTLGMAGLLYYFPNFSLFFRFLFWGLYSFFFYILLLCLNIFNVAADNPIPLVRAAYTASFLITVFTIFPVFTFIFKSNPGLLAAALSIALISFGLSFQSLWTIFLPRVFDMQSVWGSLLITLIMVESFFSLAFFPLESFFRALGLATVFYVSLSFGHHFFKKTLSLRVYLEYFSVLILVGFIIFLY